LLYVPLFSPKDSSLAFGENNEYGGNIGSSCSCKVSKPLISKVWLGGLDSNQIRCVRFP
jgi:hypothetical protein